MYRLMNESGNVFRETDSKRRRDALVADGYIEATPSAAGTVGASRRFPNTADAVFPSGQSHGAPEAKAAKKASSGKKKEGDAS